MCLISQERPNPKWLCWQPCWTELQVVLVAAHLVPQLLANAWLVNLQWTQLNWLVFTAFCWTKSTNLWKWLRVARTQIRSLSGLEGNKPVQEWWNCPQIETLRGMQLFSNMKRQFTTIATKSESARWLGITIVFGSSVSVENAPKFTHMWLRTNPKCVLMQEKPLSFSDKTNRVFWRHQAFVLHQGARQQSVSLSILRRRAGVQTKTALQITSQSLPVLRPFLGFTNDRQWTTLNESLMGHRNVMSEIVWLDHHVFEIHAGNVEKWGKLKFGWGKSESLWFTP